MDISKIRVFSITGHAQSGKTTLAEGILHKTGAVNRFGKVEEGTTISDFEPDEIERKSSINASYLYTNYKDHFIQFIDTPGYQDFIAEVIAPISVSDCVLIVIDAVSGVELGTEIAFEEAKKRNLPCIFFINKLDKENTDFYKVLADIRENITKKAISLYLPIGKEQNFKGVVSVLEKNSSEVKEVSEFYSKLLDLVAEADDTLLEKYLETGELSPEEVKKGLKKGVIERKIFPVLCGVALNEIGVEELIITILDLFPSPQERLSSKAEINGEIKELKPDVNSKFSGQVFKSIFDPYVGQLTIFRVWTGFLKSNTGFYNVTTKAKERFGQLFLLFGKEQRATDILFAGQIGAVAKLKDTHTNDSLGQEDFLVEFPKIEFPEPAISQSVKPKTKQDEEKISGALQKLSTEDPTFKVKRDPQTKELIISGVGELHLNVICQRMKRRFGAQVELGKPKIPYKETITKSVKVQGKYKRQTGGRGQYGDVWIEVEPLERGKVFEFVDKIVGGRIPRNFIPSVEKGVRKAMEEGFLAGYPLVDIRVTLYDGSYHPVDSSDIAFQIAGSMALKKAVEQAGSIILEPIMEVEIIVPEEFMGQVTGDINSRRGRVLGMEAKGKNQLIKAQVPLAEMYRYATDLRSITGGRGSYSMRFSHYEPVPPQIAQQIIEEYKRRKEEEVKK